MRLLVASVVCLLTAVPSRAEPGEEAVELRLRAATLDDPIVVPLAHRHPITDRLPAALVPVERRVEVQRGSLAVDGKGTGRSRTIVRSGRPAVVEVAAGEEERLILVFDLLGAWYAAPAAGWRSVGRPVVEILDGDGDGVPASAGDFIRRPDTPFVPLGTSRRVVWEEDPVAVSVAGKEDARQLVLTPIGRPDDANLLQWNGLRAVNRLRGFAALPPLLLDAKRSRGCQLHAAYLYENAYDYSAPWDGVGSHEELEGRPGYTPEGREAAHSAATSPDPNPAQAVEYQLHTMLHRLGYLPDAETGFGIGAVDRSKTKGARGYSVFWGGKPVLRRADLPVVLPAPGAINVPRELKPERPRVELEGFYDAPRGFPVTFSFVGSGLEQVNVQLFRLKRRGKAKEVEGYLFTPDRPKHHTRKRNGRAAMFVPRSPLASETTYAVKVTCVDATRGGAKRTFAWPFTTR